MKLLKKIVAGILALLVIVILALQVPLVQYSITRAVFKRVYPGVPLSYDKITIAFLSHVTIENLLLTGKNSDTIVYAGNITVSFSLSGLLKKNLHLNQFSLSKARINLVKDSNNLLNIENALGVPPEDTFSAETSGKNGNFHISLQNISIDDLRFSIDDPESVTGDIYLGRLDASLGKTDLQTKSVVFDKARIYNLLVTVSAGATTDNTPAASSGFDISLKNSLELNDFRGTYTDIAGKATLGISGSYLYITSEDISPDDKRIRLDSVIADSADVTLFTSETENDGTSPVNSETQDWDIGINHLSMRGNNFRSGPSHIDSAAFTLSDLNAEADSLFWKGNSYRARIRSLDFILNNDFPMKNISGYIEMDEQSAFLRNFSAGIPEGRVTITSEFYFPSPEMILTEPGSTHFSATFSGIADPDNFTGLFAVPKTAGGYPPMEFAGEVNGNLLHLSIDSFSLKAANTLDILISGYLDNLNSPSAVSADIQISSLSAYREGILDLFPDIFTKAGINMPPEVHLSGVFAGNLNQLKSDFSMDTPFGNLSSEISFSRDSAERFTADFKAERLDLGALTGKADTLGTFSAAGRLEGKTQDFKDPDINMDLNIEQLNLLGYDYNNIMVAGNYRKGRFEGMATVNDKNISMTFDGALDMSDSIPLYDFKLILDHADLQALKLADNTARVSGNLIADISGDRLNNYSGSVSATALSYSTGKQSYSLDSLTAGFALGKDSSEYTFNMYNLVSSDTTFIRTLNGGLKKLENNFEINYEANLNRSGKLNGSGDIFLKGDTVTLHNDIEFSNNVFKVPLLYSVDYTGIKAGEGRNIIKASISGKDLKVEGSAVLGSENLEADIAVDSLNTSLLEPFAGSYFNKLEGNISGNFRLEGLPENPAVTGNITLKNLTFNPVLLNIDLTIEDESLGINNSVVLFSDFTLTDENNNKAIINGSMNFSRQNGSFDLSAKASGLRLLNKGSDASGMFYGDVTGDFDATVTGKLSMPLITVDALFDKESDFHFTIPQEQAKTREREGIVEFTGADSVTSDTSRAGSPSFMMEIVSNVSLTDNFRITMITDPVSGENLEVRGNGDLSFSVNRSGTIQLTGRYSIDEGSYRLRLYDIINRDFSIEKGSYLAWTGDITDPDTDITAIYEVRTDPTDYLRSLYNSTVESPVSGSGNIIVRVIMSLSGKLLSPDINFDIETNTADKGTELASALAALNENESELNKQVFSLLLFNNFMSEGNGAGSPVNYDISNTARQGLSDLLTQQLNRFSGQYIKGVDLKFNLESFNARNSDVAARTNLSLDVSKSLFNNRLTVQIGGSLAVNEYRNDAGASLETNNLLGDFLVEYRLDRKGTYRLQAFNRTEYEDIINGEVLRTGIAFIINRDFTRLTEIFKRNTGRNGKK